MEFMLPVLIIAMIVFFFFSQKKRKRQIEELQTKMVPGVEVMTSFGMFGTLKSVDADTNKAELEIAPGCTVTVHSQTLARVEEDPADQDVSEAVAEVVAEAEAVVEAEAEAAAEQADDSAAKPKAPKADKTPKKPSSGEKTAKAPKTKKASSGGAEA